MGLYSKGEANGTVRVLDQLGAQSGLATSQPPGSKALEEGDVADDWCETVLNLKPSPRS